MDRSIPAGPTNLTAAMRRAITNADILLGVARDLGMSPADVKEAAHIMISLATTEERAMKHRGHLSGK